MLTQRFTLWVCPLSSAPYTEHLDIFLHPDMPVNIQWKSILRYQLEIGWDDPTSSEIPSSRREKKFVYADAPELTLHFLLESSDACHWHPLKSANGAIHHILLVVEDRGHQSAHALHLTDCLVYSSQLRGASQKKRFAYESVSNICLSFYHSRYNGNLTRAVDECHEGARVRKHHLWHSPYTFDWLLLCQ